MTIHGTAAAYIVVTILTVTAEEAYLWSHAVPAQITIHTFSCAHVSVAESRERARLVAHGMTSAACLVSCRSVHDWWPCLILLGL